MAYFNSNDLPPKILGFGHDIHYNRTFHCNCFFAWLVAGKERKTFGKIALIGVGMVAGNSRYVLNIRTTLGGSGGEDIDISPPEITDDSRMTQRKKLLSTSSP